MQALSLEYIQRTVADSRLIYMRGEAIYKHGSYFLSDSNLADKTFTYSVDGAHGDYRTRIRVRDDGVESSCTCPYPGNGCKHVVAAALGARNILVAQKTQQELFSKPDTRFLSREEIREQALADRQKRARSESFTLVAGDLYKGDHRVKNKKGRLYRICFHDPANGRGHCTCPDYMTNGLGTCKHLIFAQNVLKKETGFENRLERERFAFTDIFWDSAAKAPSLFSEQPGQPHDLWPLLSNYFDARGKYIAGGLSGIMALADQLSGDKRVCIRENLLKRVATHIHEKEIKELSKQDLPKLPLKTRLYPFQAQGVRFGLYKTGVLIGDEMGLGKTLQAIGLCVLKKEIFGFSKVLVITLASLKEQWKREIEKFSHEKARVVEGGPVKRAGLYTRDDSFFKITNYEAVLRDVTVLSRFNPDIIVLDEAQRIKNFSTKTADAVKQIPKKHGIVLTGTPLENKLEDVYSIVQFLDLYLLTPLWEFAADHFLLSRGRKTGISGYANLDKLKKRLERIVIRRKKKEVLKDLPDVVENTYYIDLTHEQQKMHGGFGRSLAQLLRKKFLTPMDLRNIQMLLLRMRQVCNSTFLLDRETHISPKLTELAGIIDETVVQNKRKIVIFSEWTTMTFLIARQLSDMGISFIELSGKVPVKKRQALIDEYTRNPDCRVFLSTDAGGTGLNLQAADCVINFELPWNPARMNQRIGRVSRIGQKSGCVNVINLVARQSIEERILAGIQMKTDLFKGVFDQGPDRVEFSREKKNELLEQLRRLMDGEDADMPLADTSVSPEEIPEDDPHFLNPKVLERQEETSGPPQTDDAAQAGETLLASQPPEKIETVLNSGMEFIAGLMEMATGQKIDKARGEKQMVRLDKETGEVTMTFKLPGF